MIVTQLWAAAFRALLVLSCGALLAATQLPANEVPPPSQAQTVKPQFFGGTVVELDAHHIKVSRTLVGRPTESRNFGITPATKLNKNNVKLRTRVTVRYRHEADADIALEVQPRPVVRPTKRPAL